MTSADFFADAASIGELFRLARVRESRTQQVVAEAAGISAAHLSRLERGEKLPGPWVAYGLARALELCDIRVTQLIFQEMSQRAGADEARYFKQYHKARDTWRSSSPEQWRAEVHD